jgi:hypothetical protein
MMRSEDHIVLTSMLRRYSEQAAQAGRATALGRRTATSLAGGHQPSLAKSPGLIA